MATSVLQSPDLVAAIAAYQEGLPEDLAAAQRIADAIELTPCFNEEQTGYLAHVPTRFAWLPYLQRYPHPTTKLPNHALFVSPRVYDPALALHLAVVDGDMALVQHWLRWAPSLCTSATLELAAAASQGPILRLLLAQFSALATTKMMDLAALSGDLALLTWLHEVGAHCTSAAMDGAAMNGHLDVVVFLHAMRAEGCTSVAATAAVVHGHSAIVQYFLSERTEGVKPSLDFEAPHGEHKTHCAVDLVAATVQLTDAAFTRIVKQTGLAALHHLAVATQDHPMLRYVLECIDLEEYPRPQGDDEWLPPDAPEDTTVDFRQGPRRNADVYHPIDRWEHCCVMQLAAFNGDITSLELLHKSRLRVGSDRAIDYAGYCGHMDVLDWLHTHRRDGCTEDAMTLAAVAGRLDVVRWLHEDYGLCRTHAALTTSAWAGHSALVMYLLDEPTSGADNCTDMTDNSSRYITTIPPLYGGAEVHYFKGSATYCAVSQGHLEIVELLVARGHAVPSTAINEAVSNGHLHVVRYLHEGFGHICTCYRSLLEAVVGLHMDTVAYVLRKSCWQLGRSLSNDDRTDIALHMLLVATARSGSLSTLQLVCDIFPVNLATELSRRVSERMLLRAASHGHLEMLQHLHDRYGFGWTPLVREAAMRRGHRKVLRYIGTLGPATASAHAIDERGLWREGRDLMFHLARVDGVLRVQPM
ncbi:hypothetical protein SPRG_07728 [Saprolegnia parasitica CBS 223.65]|uniref:Ankyrin repeat protein n=1 Tax=Saprolegnia parasitica (strain CBS 223.65) TaxID=695850 RepID=A0A067CKD0_SAPPC|nr:hypothetical protein SPRG_07728 [Saprolegnia parasitica CBS 223.65]KDO27016.1 hypothetical protein SPRG_07728 [Saprolegnia parasitica CBS 223.65]|eukprot:XP_012202393.1 hypothetical protein SPRG_07728 [Saprolegnia parasitica CBS 223.65]